MSKEQVTFKPVKASEMPLNGKQLDLLALVSDAGESGCLVYGRGPTETIDALAARGLVVSSDMVQVIVMGKLENRTLWTITEKGKLLLA
jgi:hypothetical protein